MLPWPSFFSTGQKKAEHCVTAPRVEPSDADKTAEMLPRRLMYDQYDMLRGCTKIVMSAATRSPHYPHKTSKSPSTWIG